MTDEKTVWDAEFNPSVTIYWLISGLSILLVTLIGIPLIPFWLIFGPFVTGRYLASHRCTLTSRNLKVTKGILVRTEKTVPLDRITDLGLTQGPIMRALGIEALTVETAGQSTGGSLIRLAGIKDGREYRDAVLHQRDLVVGSDEEKLMPPSDMIREADGSPQTELLREIRDVLLRVEDGLNKAGE